jgi:hypothetical protein
VLNLVGSLQPEKKPDWKTVTVGGKLKWTKSYRVGGGSSNGSVRSSKEGKPKGKPKGKLDSTSSNSSVGAASKESLRRSPARLKPLPGSNPRSSPKS